MSQTYSTRELARAAIIAAAYAALAWFSSVFGLAYGPIQFRLSEALCVLPYRSRTAVPGLFIGCLIANLFSTVSALDIIVGTAATLLACLLTRYIKNTWLLPLPTILCNMLMVGAMLSALYMPAGEFWKGLAIFGAEVGAGEAAVLYILGVPLYRFIRKTGLMDKLLGRG